MTQFKWFAVIPALFLGSVSHAFLLQRTFTNSGCFISENYVGLVYQGEEVDGKDHLTFTNEIPNMEVLKSTIEAAKQDGNVVIPGIDPVPSPLKGYIAYAQDKSVIRLGSSEMATVALIHFTDLNCQAE